MSDYNDYPALRDVKKGEYVRRKVDARTTYIRGDYDRASKTYELTDFDDIGRSIFLKGSTQVYINFTF